MTMPAGREQKRQEGRNRGAVPACTRAMRQRQPMGTSTIENQSPRVSGSIHVFRTSIRESPRPKARSVDVSSDHAGQGR